MRAAGGTNYDAIVVGTGPGGATVARELTRRGKKVLILEWGPGKPIRGNFLQFENAKRVLKAAGATDIYKTWYLAAHPGGTVKLGELVDGNLQTKFQNLFVCDCSVIPRAWGLPPTLTLLGLGRYLGRKLAGEQVPEKVA